MRVKPKEPKRLSHEMTSFLVCCPVCKQYLKQEESLHVHLNTHPKEHVIEALIQLKDACKDHNPPSLTEKESSPLLHNVDCDNEQQELSSGAENVQAISWVGQPTTEESVKLEAPSTSSTQYAVSPCVASPSSGHIVPYSQLITGSTSVAQFIHVPVVTSAVPNPVPPSSAQTPVVLYGPFVCPPGSSEPAVTITSDLMNPAHHLQFLTNNSVMRPSYSIIQAHASSNVPQVTPLPVPQSFSELKVPTTSGHILFMPASQGSGSVQNHSISNAQSETRVDCTCENSSQLEQSVNHSFGVIKSDVTESNQESGHNSDSDPYPRIHELQSSPLLPQLNSEDIMLSLPKKEISSEWNNSSTIVPISTCERSSGTHLTANVESVLRLKSNLLSLPKEISVSCERAKSGSNTWPSVPRTGLKQEEPSRDESADDSCPASGSNTPLKLSTVAVEINSCESSCIDPSDFLAQHLEASNKEIEFQDDTSIGRPNTPPCESAPPSPYQKSLDSPSTPLNIQTDETMPPRGELSEQESIGGNSSSMWSVPAYNISRELPSPVVSYDLTARESWPGSEMSDAEGNANATDGHQAKCFSSSFTNTLHAFIAKPTADGSFATESPLSTMGKGDTSNIPSKNSPNENTSTSRIKKAPAKPRVYRCKECSSAFATLKLKRMHLCEQIKSTNDSSSVTVMRMTAVVEGVSEKNISIPGSSTQEEELSTQTKPKKKYTRKPKATIKKEVIVDDQSSGQANFAEQYRISKTEPEDISESRTNSQVSSVIQETVSSESSVLKPVSSDVTFVEVPLKHEAVAGLCAGEYPCSKCDQVYQSAKLLSQHISNKHKGPKYQCATCNDSFEKERDYYDHLMVHPLECQECGKTFTRRKYLALHMKRHLNVKPYKCETCGKSFVTKQKLVEHHNTHTGNAPIKCSDCDGMFRRYSNLIQHRNKYHLNVKPKVKDYFCHCGEVFPSKQKLEWHKEIHDNKPKSCQYCSEKFVHTVSLTRHVRRTHDRRYVPKKGREGENIECPVCRLVFLKSSLATHIKIHSGERPFPCHICGKDFTTKWNLQLHRWTHASRSSRPFKCTLCKASFYRKQDYQSHQHSHRNVRPYTCNYCGCKFLRKYNCNRHMREHEGAKNYTCTICNKTFHRRYYLNDHMRVHSGTRPFTCHICGKASTSKSNHNKHVRIHHAREPQNAEI